ncbi:hypothetical protein CHS0354_000598 [Potamilus streckersoni]|uniref:UmuC domain-containing protein n=1 Tax=Potamilus streckersoni TaxID=2493646 RepID=A0AAE0W8F3_9BIVA|nr:hypothetical protein CHS0354_000598 [Potamilus streckersoni]
MFALVDCNNFFVSCECVFRPDLTGKPVVVLSNNDGCVVSRSNEAKKMGIPMGAPAFKYEPLFKQHHVSVFSSNFALYGDMSHRVMSILETLSPEIEIYSIDEAFLDLTEFHNLHEYGKRIHAQILKWTGIPISIGIAKAANKIAKKFLTETKSVYVLDDERKQDKALHWLKVEDVWGIGRTHAELLRKKNISTAYQFTQLPDAWIKANMSITGVRLKHDLLGMTVLSLEKISDKKSITTSRSFEKLFTDLDSISECVNTFAVSCAEKLRMDNLVCGTVAVFIRTNHFRQDLPQYSKQIVLPLPFQTNSSVELATFATQALQQIFVKGYHYKKAGVTVMNLVKESHIQPTLFENSNPKHRSLMETIDRINGIYGKHSIRLASQGVHKVWKVKQERISPCYSTKLSDVITVNV